MPQRPHPRSRPSRSFLLFALAGCIAVPLCPRPVVAQDLSCDPGDPEVMRLEFEGNLSFGDGELADSVVTTPSSWWRRTTRLPGGAERCLDTTELARDELRLAIFYRKHGFYKASISSRVDTLDPGEVAVRFLIDEGDPVILDSLTVTGLPSPEDSARFLRGLDLAHGSPDGSRGSGSAVGSGGGGGWGGGGARPKAGDSIATSWQPPSKRSCEGCATTATRGPTCCCSSEWTRSRCARR
ncbi:MAG: POTRA domain-containing protein [Gemmatimonadaceae bacterium]